MIYEFMTIDPSNRVHRVTPPNNNINIFVGLWTTVVDK